MLPKQSRIPHGSLRKPAQQALVRSRDVSCPDAPTRHGVQCAHCLCGSVLRPQNGPVGQSMKDLKEKTIRGGAARMLAQIATFVFRVGSVMIVARLVDPHDTGLVQMVTAFTGVLNLFRDFGLSTATVQREHVTDEQISTLFWINVAVGTLLAGIAVAFSPLVVRF